MMATTQRLGSGPVRDAAPLFGAKGLAAALLIALMLCWPMLVASGPLYFFDTIFYLNRGEKIMMFATGGEAGGAQAAGGTGAAADAGGGGGGGQEGLKIRSLPYALYLYLTVHSPLGLYLTCLLQSWVVIWAFFALIPQAALKNARTLAIGLLLVGAFSSLPWFASYAMPDVLGAILPIFYICLLRRMDELLAWQRWALAALTAGAILTHYGNVPLAAALAVAVLGWRALTGSLRVEAVLLASAPIIVAIGFNFAAGSVAAKEASAAPKRLPILLARSLEDGPARWYLDDACPEAGYAMCDMFETMPTNITEFMWEEDGYAGATDAQIEAIRAEENAILWQSFKRYPIEQSRALLGNTALQTVRVGLDEMWPISPEDSPLSPDTLGQPDRDSPKPAGVTAFDWIVPIATLIFAIAYVLAIVTGRVGRPGVEALVLLAFTLIVNAAIFGGLSAPVDRYQGRLVWLIPALLTVYLAMPRPSSLLGTDVRRMPSLQT